MSDDHVVKDGVAMQSKASRRSGPTNREGALLESLEELRANCVAAETEFARLLAKVRPSRAESARNLVHYVALRRHDLRAVQEELASLGLSSLGRCEAHVLASLDAVLDVLRRLEGLAGTGDTRPFAGHAPRLEDNADLLLGSLAAGRVTRVMVTLPAKAATDKTLAGELVGAGMDVARINCAHDSAADWKAMAEHVRAAAVATGHPCLVAMDLAGPKLRTGVLPPGAAVLRVAPRRDSRGVVLAPALVWLHPPVSPGVSPSIDAVAIPVDDEAWLASCRVNHTIHLLDARDAKRRIRVLHVDKQGVLAEVMKTTYFESGVTLNLNGPGKPRKALVGLLPTQDPFVTLAVGDALVLTRKPDEPWIPRGRSARVSCTLPEVFDHAEIGHHVWFDDGKIGAIIESRSDAELGLRIIDARPGGVRLRGGKGINLPDTNLAIPSMTVQDEADLKVAVQIADIIDVSFVRGPADVEHVQKRLVQLKAKNVGLVLKIETVAGFERLPEILLTLMRSERTGVMIARGDLAVEAGFERMAEVQEEILWLCEAAHMPVIWATQVLDQLARTGRASRAEITDAALSARAECIMLNKGPYIVAAMSALLDIHRRMHEHQHKKQSLFRRLRAWDHDSTESAPGVAAKPR